MRPAFNCKYPLFRIVGVRLGRSARGIDTASALTKPDNTRLTSSMPLQVSRTVGNGHFIIPGAQTEKRNRLRLLSI